jgi:hypothetical protein
VRHGGGHATGQRLHKGKSCFNSLLFRIRQWHPLHHILLEPVEKLAVEAMATAMPNWKAKALSAAPAPNFSPK